MAGGMHELLSASIPEAHSLPQSMTIANAMIIIGLTIKEEAVAMSYLCVWHGRHALLYQSKKCRACQP